MSKCMIKVFGRLPKRRHSKDVRSAEVLEFWCSNEPFLANFSQLVSWYLLPITALVGQWGLDFRAEAPVNVMVWRMHLPYESRGRRRREMAELEPYWLQSIVEETMQEYPDLGNIHHYINFNAQSYQEVSLFQ